MATPTDQASLRTLLVDNELVIPIPGSPVVGFSGTFERIVTGIEQAMTAMEPTDTTKRSFPPLLPEDAFIKTGYLGSFPQLIGSLNVFTGDTAAHKRMTRAQHKGEDWTEHLEPARLDMLSAGCHSIYPTLAGQTLPDARRFELTGRCFRHEPSPDPFRLISFRMREKVCIGTPDQAKAHRDLVKQKAPELLRSLGLEISVDVANDPFFGRAASLFAEGQREDQLKFEFVCPVYADHPGVAVGSVNYHNDHFGLDFDIKTADGEPAHSACLGFGLERVTIALIATHGPDLDRWPAEVRTRLGLDS